MAFTFRRENWNFWTDATWKFLRVTQLILAGSLLLTLLLYFVGAKWALVPLAVLVLTHLVVASLLMVRTFELRKLSKK
jgi:hypothetical protein